MSRLKVVFIERIWSNTSSKNHHIEFILKAQDIFYFVYLFGPYLTLIYRLNTVFSIRIMVIAADVHLLITYPQTGCTPFTHCSL
jgi:hypothetical protein